MRRLLSVVAGLFVLGIVGCTSNASVPAPHPEPSETPSVQVANSASNSVTFYPVGANGNVAPVGILQGPSTQLRGPTRAFPITGKFLYVSDRDSDAITGYPGPNSGNVAPSVRIAGAKTRIVSPSCVQLDAAQHIWVSSEGNNAMLEFAAGANGNVAPIARITGPETGINGPESFHVSFRTGKIYVSNRTSNSIEVFAEGSDGDTPPIQFIQGSETGLNDPGQIEQDSKGNLWVANTGGGDVLEFDTDATGNVAPIGTIVLAGRPFRPYGVAIDTSDNLVISDSSHDALYEFASTARGPSNPIATLHGTATGLHAPAQLGIPQPIATPIPELIARPRQ
jgi:sugar lactone lactonase YvrE